MPALITSRDAVLKPAQSAEYREDITFSSVDAARHRIRAGDYAILKSTHVVPDVPGRQYAVRLMVGDAGEARPNTLMVNSSFFDELQFGLGQEWELHGADHYQPIQSLALEPSVEQERLKEDLRRFYRAMFIGRCLLVQPGQTISDLSLRVAEQAYFNIHDIVPLPGVIRETTILGIEDRTEINLFVPHRKGGIDMVIVVDASGSMDLRDYIDRRGECLMRIQGARRALETLLEQRLYSGSRVSRFALVAFGKDARVIYPPDREDMVELSSYDVEAMRREIPNLTRRVNRDGTDIAEGMDTAADLLYKNAREDNEKIIVLLSDGAHWVEQQDTGFKIEVRVGHEDPVMFADNLYDEGQIRIHTVAISNEENLRRYEPQYTGQKGATPNPKMLDEIARRTRAKFFSSPDAEILNKLFDDLGKGGLFPL
jgi:hypothetical protein